jgi:hypothetical protein
LNSSVVIAVRIERRIEIDEFVFDVAPEDLQIVAVVESVSWKPRREM